MLGSVITFFSCLILVLVQININQSYEKLDNDRLNHMVYSASDSAVEFASELMLTDIIRLDNGTTYLDKDYVYKNYKYVFLSSLDIYSLLTDDQLESHIPVSVIAIDDGYYMRLLTDTYNTETNSFQPEYLFSSKIPFARKTTEDSITTHIIPETGTNIIEAGTYVADTFSGENIVTYNKEEDKYVIVQNDGNSIQSKKGSIHDKQAIANSLKDAIQYSIDFNTLATSELKNTKGISMPSSIEDTLSTNNLPFLGPSFYSIITEFNLLSTNNLSFASVANNQIIEAFPIYCYTIDSVKYYSYEKLDNRFLEQTYSNVDQAIEDGYIYYNK